jgi:hypothetical protein
VFHFTLFFLVLLTGFMFHFECAKYFVISGILENNFSFGLGYSLLIIFKRKKMLQILLFSNSCLVKCTRHWLNSINQKRKGKNRHLVGKKHPKKQKKKNKRRALDKVTQKKPKKLK